MGRSEARQAGVRPTPHAVADLVFDAPVEHPFSYAIPAGLSVAAGQRVWAPLHGAERCGLVVAVRDGDAAGLKHLTRAADPSPVLAPPALGLVRWIAAQSLSTLGSTALSLLPPPPTAGQATPIAPAERAKPELLVGPGRETRLLEAVTAAPAALILAADVDGAARWARRLGAVDRVARLDSGVSERTRAEAWQRLASGDVRLAVGTRGALL
ncbi:MAG: hypothetical protein HY216_08880, partial [Candidatus Rokubacteria bacterium]|nr:hypothetical protein [Candidatus Rokubacteria bacterium]